jgi:hypothetical protein
MACLVGKFILLDVFILFDALTCVVNSIQINNKIDKNLSNLIELVGINFFTDLLSFDN